MNAIEICGLTKKFNSTSVIKDINLCITDGDFFGLLGKNGAGKSTLINILTGTFKKTAGSFKILDIWDSKIDSIKKSIGVMPDVSTLYNDMTGYGFLNYMSNLKNIKLSKTDLKNLFEKVCLEAPSHMKIKDYSFGMKKKISIAQAVIGEPKLIFLDEPTSGVDPESILHLQKLFKSLNRNGSTIFITSHNLNEIEKLCTHIAILKNGKLQINGNIEDIINSFTKNYKVIVNCYIPENFNMSESFKNFHLLSAEKNNLVFEVDNIKSVSEIVNCLVNYNIKIYSVNPEKATLEDVFLS